MRSRPPREDATIGVIQTSPTRSSSACGPPNGSGLLSLLSRRQPREASIGRYPPPPRPSTAIPSAQPTASTTSSRRASKTSATAHACAHTPCNAPPHQQPEPRSTDAHPPRIRAPRPQPAAARRTAHPRRQRRADPAPQHRTHQPSCHSYDQHRRKPEGPSDLAKDRGPLQFKDTQSLAGPTTTRAALFPHAEADDQLLPSADAGLNDANPGCGAELK